MHIHKHYAETVPLCQQQTRTHRHNHPPRRATWRAARFDPGPVVRFMRPALLSKDVPTAVVCAPPLNSSVPHDTVNWYEPISPFPPPETPTQTVSKEGKTQFYHIKLIRALVSTGQKQTTRGDPTRQPCQLQPQPQHPRPTMRPLPSPDATFHPSTRRPRAPEP